MTNAKRRKRTAPNDPNKMQLVVTGGGEEPFKLPEGWGVEVRPRGPRSSVRISDKYYYEPGTRRQFRSLLSVKRYLDSKEESPSCSRVFESRTDHHHSPDSSAGPVYSSNANNGKIWKPGELQLATIEKKVVTTSDQQDVSSSIPDGWIVEKIHRKNGTKSDTYYIEVVSGLKLRSLTEVHRFLAEDHQIIPKKKPALDMIIKPSTPPKFSSSRKKIITSPPDQEYFDISEPPPKKVTWVLHSSHSEEEGSWSPFVEKSKVPGSVKEVWHEKFMIGMTGVPPAPKKPNLPQLTWIQHIHPDRQRSKE